MDHGESKTPTRDLLANFVENLQQPNARLCVSTPNNLGSEDVHYTSSEVFPLIVTAVNAHDALVEALDMCLELLDDMSRFASIMSLEDYGLFNMAPIKARAALKLARGES